MAAKLPFTEDDLKAAAGPTSYARGLGYVDQVEYLAVGDTWVTATVVGSDAYVVRVSFGDDRHGVIHARACHEALDTSDEFRQYIVLLRMAQKRKRTLMKILDQSGL